MATVHNPTDFNLFCLTLRRTIDAGETVTVDPELARQVRSSVFQVEVGLPARKAVKRGGKVAEVTEGPAKETR